MKLDFNVWKRGNQRAVHKPLLLLYTLSQYQKGHDRFFTFEEIHDPIKELLIEFGPFRQSHHPEYPFWRLKNDGFWELKKHENVQARLSNTDAKKSELLKYGVEGGLNQQVYDQLIGNKDKLARTIGNLLDEFFPDTIHGDLIEKLDITEHISNSHKHTSNFRDSVLTAYEYKCAICGFDCRLGNTHMGVDAACIQWFQNNGPYTVDNGIAMCALHHKAFDRGVFTISKAYKVLLSPTAEGGDVYQSLFFKLNNNRIFIPKSTQKQPKLDFIQWHQKNIYKSKTT